MSVIFNIFRRHSYIFRTFLFDENLRRRSGVARESFGSRAVVVRRVARSRSGSFGGRSGVVRGSRGGRSVAVRGPLWMGFATCASIMYKLFKVSYASATFAPFGTQSRRVQGLAALHSRFHAESSDRETEGGGRERRGSTTRQQTRAIENTREIRENRAQRAKRGARQAKDR